MIQLVTVNTKNEEAFILKSISQPGGLVYTVDARFFNESASSLEYAIFGISPESLGKYATRGQKTSIAQLFEVVHKGLILATSIHVGLKRDCFSNGDMNSGKQKLIYAWKSSFDAEWDGDRFNGGPKRIISPPNRVFVVLVSPNLDKTNFPDIKGWIEHWTWIEEDKIQIGKPVNSKIRYEKLLWEKT